MDGALNLTVLDISFFVLFFAVVIGVSLYKSRKEETGEDFFLASRGLIWPLIGISLIAANISTEHFVGMAGQGAGITGLAVASYEWIAAIVLVFVALFFLPVFLKAGIFTIPEFLEHRYNPAARAIMAFYTMIIYVGVTIAAVIYTGALPLKTIFGIDLIYAVILIGGVAAFYTTWGGLKAVAWADLFQGSALIIGGAITLFIGLQHVGGLGSFLEANEERLHMVLPADHPVLPWTSLVLGLWIPNFYYWGLNQFIVQRSLAAKTMKQGQLGVIFAAFLKLLIPFVIIFPGIIAFQLYEEQFMTQGINPDEAYPMLIKNIIPEGVRAFIFAALCGAVISSLASMLNSASTIFTMDLYKRHMKPDASPRALVRMGRITTMIFVVIGCFIAPWLGHPMFKGIFNYIQEFQGFISPGILAVFLFGLFIKRAPSAAAVTALLMNPIIYGLLLPFRENIAFLNRMAITLGVILAVMAVITLVSPLKEPRVLPVREDFDARPAPSIKILGVTVIVITVVLYYIFW